MTKKIYIPQELNKIAIALQVDSNEKPILFAIPEMEKALSIWKKVKIAIKEKEFIETAIEFTTDEKVFIAGLVSNRQWDVMSAESVVTLLEKLS